MWFVRLVTMIFDDMIFFPKYRAMEKDLSFSNISFEKAIGAEEMGPGTLKSPPNVYGAARV